ncbi:hypothetical protein ASF41_13305 [Methylobacterium sp. Leaf111]|nr:hypothetical protein ASF18_18000 [Methylobacterium sp. Leaf89]KQP51154.1 hypothetical protein ASF41_13305 [Methylobacterium sp. Leaf111]
MRDRTMVGGEDDLLRFLDRDAADAVFREHVARATEAAPLADEKVSTASPAVSLMITNRQRAELRALGFSEDTIRCMTPAEAHEHLGLDKPGG